MSGSSPPTFINVNPLPPDKVCTYSNHGIKPGMYGKASAKINQDRGFITYPLAGDRQMALFCVYDGHGSNGEQVSEFLMLKVPDLLEEDPQKLHAPDGPSEALVYAFENADRQLRDSSIASSVSGSTGVAVLMHGSKLWSANVGDSRAVVGRRKGGALAARDLTIDQKPDAPAERKRIEAAGGYVSPESAQYGPARVWLRPGEGPGLAMSRSLGDHMCSHVGVIATPEVACHELSADDEVLILASDGVWEFISSEEAVAIVEKTSTAQEATAALINEATVRWRKEEGNYRDDVTAMVVHLASLLPGDGAAARRRRARRAGRRRRRAGRRPAGRCRRAGRSGRAGRGRRRRRRRDVPAAAAVGGERGERGGRRFARCTRKVAARRRGGQPVARARGHRRMIRAAAAELALLCVKNCNAP